MIALPGRTLIRAARACFRFLDFPKLVFFVLFLWFFFSVELTDPDFYWHLKTGEYLVNSGGLPTRDPFSYTFSGKPWVLHEWLFEVGLYAISAALGTWSIKLLTAGVGVLSLYIVYTAAKRLLPDSTLPILITCPFFMLLQMALAPRPQLITYLCLAVLLHVLIEFKYAKRARFLWSLPLLMIVWANSHGGFMVGIALLGVFTCCEWWTHLRRDPGDRNRLIELSAVGLLTVLASTVNPYFLDHWLYPFEVMNLKLAISVIEEWQSPNFQEAIFKIYLIVALGFLVLMAYRRTKPDLTEMVLPVAFIFMAFVARRHIPLAALVMIPFSAAALRDTRLPQLYRRWVGRGTDLGARECVINWAALGAVALTLVLCYPAKHAEATAAMNEGIPVKAVEFIQGVGIEGRIFNAFEFGGYLIQQLYPAQRVFIYGRPDVFGDEFFRRYLDIYYGAPAWEQAFDEYRIDYVLVSRQAPLRQLLLTRGDFRLVYDDGHNSILVKDIPRFGDIIAKHGRPPGSPVAAAP